ncbi:MAG: hypothetical protein MdMp024_0458 [Bacteroidales bacterium]
MKSTLETLQPLGGILSVPPVLLSQTNKGTTTKETIADANRAQRLELDTQLTPLLKSLLRDEDFKFGRSNESIRTVEKALQENEAVTKEWFTGLFNQYIGAEKETHILIGLLHIVEFLSEYFQSDGTTMALAALKHHNIEVRELGVEILESTCSVEHLNILKNIHTDPLWLQEYIEQVIKDFEQELCPS